MSEYFSEQLHFIKVMDGQGGQVGDTIVFAYATQTVQPIKPVNGQAPATPWKMNEPVAPVEGAYTWMTSTTRTSAGTYGTWTNPIRITGEQGEIGEDGKGIEFIYYRSNSDLPPGTPTGIGNGWTQDPTGVDQNNSYEYISLRTSNESGTWSQFTAPKLWAKYGTDGQGISYIYKRTTDSTAPTRPTTSGPGRPSDWTDEPQGVDSTNQYEWISVSHYIDESWSQYSIPALFNRYVRDGDSPTSYRMQVSAAAISKSKAGTFTPTALSCSGTYQTGSSAPAAYTGYFQVEGWNGTSWISLGTGTTSASGTASSTYTKYRCSMYTNSGKTVLLDREEVPLVIDGSDTLQVDLTNSSHTFAGDTDSVAATESVVVTAKGYKGATAENVQIMTVNNVSAATTSQATGITGLSFACSTTSAAASPTVTFTATTSMTTKSGYIPIVIRINGVDFTKNFSYAIAIKGTTGDQGPQGIPGPVGSNGQSLYTWVKYADNSSGSGMSDSPVGKTYIGLAYNKTTATESSTVGDYTWSLIQGAQGIQGPPGSNGQSLYTWIKYASTPTTGMSDSPTGKKYLGIAYNKTTSTESSTYADYSWSLIEGPQGAKGDTGDQGPQGIPAEQYNVVPSVNTVIRKLLSPYISPTSMTFKVYKTTGSGSPVLVTSGVTNTIAYSTDGINFTNVHSSIQPTSSGTTTLTLNNATYNFARGSAVSGYKDAVCVRCISTIGGVEVDRITVGFSLDDALLEIARIDGSVVKIDGSKIYAKTIVASDAIYDGSIKADQLDTNCVTTGKIDSNINLTISAQGKLEMNSALLKVTSGSTNATAVALRNDTDYFLSAGHLTQSSAPFWVKKDGSIKASSGVIGGFSLSSGKLIDTATNGDKMEIDPVNGLLDIGDFRILQHEDPDRRYIDLFHQTPSVTSTMRIINSGGILWLEGAGGYISLNNNLSTKSILLGGCDMVVLGGAVSNMVNGVSYPFLTSQNYSSYALPLSGGTIQDGTLKVQGTAAGAGYGVVTRSIQGSNSTGSAYGELFLNYYNQANIYCRGTYVNIDSGNYTSYAPTKTGTGASGTWGISISGTAAGNLPLSGGTLTGDLLVQKSNAWLTLDSDSAGDNGVEQAAGLSIGEAGKKGGASIHITYTGDGYGHIGMGTVSATTSLPTYEAIKFHYQSNVAQFFATPTVNGIEVSLNGHTHSYVPLSGGTMTGTLTVNATINGNMLQSNYPGNIGESRFYKSSNASTDYGTYIIDYDSNTSNYNRLRFGYSQGHNVTLQRVTGGSQEWLYTLVHSGNYSNYVTPAGIGAAASSHNHTGLTSFASISSSGAKDWQMVFSNDTYIYMREGTASSTIRFYPDSGNLWFSGSLTGGTVPWARVSGAPTSYPASDVSAWAKASTKPSYTHTEVGAAASGHNHNSDYIKIQGSGDATGITSVGATNTISSWSNSTGSTGYPSAYGQTWLFGGSGASRNMALWCANGANDLWFSGIDSNGAIISWCKFLDSANYTSYTVTKTGSGASGTWGISVTGSSASLATARTLTIGSTGKTFNGTANVSWSLAEIGAAAASHSHSYVSEGGTTFTGTYPLVARIGANNFYSNTGITFIGSTNTLKVTGPIYEEGTALSSKYQRKVLSGTADPVNTQGSDGDIYIKYFV